MKIPICYEDDYIIAVSKPCNVLVHHSFMARNMDNEATLIDLLSEQYHQKLSFT
jgi:tRNA pseudouridine65 synthase